MRSSPSGVVTSKPCPGCSVTVSSLIVAPCASPYATIACASGCRLCCSAETMSESFAARSSSGMNHCNSVTEGLPRVSVPVLSMRKALTRGSVSSAVASAKSMFRRADSPTATVKAVGVAKPKAQGQAITRTEIA